jgi:hypothetical protein
MFIHSSGSNFRSSSSQTINVMFPPAVSHSMSPAIAAMQVVRAAGGEVDLGRDLDANKFELMLRLKVRK